MKTKAPTLADRMSVHINWAGIAEIIGAPGKTEAEIRAMRLVPAGTRPRRQRKIVLRAR
jgi:hypothetical protein